MPAREDTCRRPSQSLASPPSWHGSQHKLRHTWRALLLNNRECIPRSRAVQRLRMAAAQKAVLLSGQVWAKGKTNAKFHWRDVERARAVWTCSDLGHNATKPIVVKRIPSSRKLIFRESFCLPTFPPSFQAAASGLSLVSSSSWEGKLLPLLSRSQAPPRRCR